jgi:hypothetical protein
MTVTTVTVILRWRSMNQVIIIFIDFSKIKDCFSLVFVFSGVLLCIELIYTVALSSYNNDMEKSTVLKNAEMRVTVNKDARN